MSPEEIESHKGDTLDLSKVSENAIGNTLQDIIMQVQQDGLIEMNMPISLSLLDSVFLDILPINNAHCIVSLDKERNVLSQYGTDVRDRHNVVVSKEYPIGTKGLQYLQIYTQVPISDYLKKMVVILASSVAIVILVFVILLSQLVVLRKKERILCMREASLHGTIHDLKSPLGNMVTLLSWISDEEKDCTKKNVIESVSRKVRGLINDIELLLTTAKSQNSNKSIDLDYSSIIPEELAAAAIDKISEDLLAKSHTINIHNALSGVNIRGDKVKLENVLKNLIENALKYSDADVSIDVSFQEADKYHTISVSDNGWGIESGQLRKIFKPFYQLPNRKGIANCGYGIGLSYVKFILKAHKGNVKISSNLSSGTIITLFLPK